MKDIKELKLRRSFCSPSWYLKQLLPLTYRSIYKAGNEKHFCVWNMWFGKCFNVQDFVVK